VFHATRRASVAEALNNIRQVKFAMDGFASDHNGRYPHEHLHDQLGTSGSSSNALFRQLFLAGETGSETIFWVRDSSVTSRRPPDDKIEHRGTPDPDLILQPGDNHWAYAHGLGTNSHPHAPLLIDAAKLGTSHFDPKLWDHKALVLRVDSSARALRLRVSNHKIRAKNGDDLFDPQVAHWGGTPPDIRQPE
jgi:hypothetical protein